MNNHDKSITEFRLWNELYWKKDIEGIKEFLNCYKSFIPGDEYIIYVIRNGDKEMFSIIIERLMGWRSKISESNDLIIKYCEINGFDNDLLGMINTYDLKRMKINYKKFDDRSIRYFIKRGAYFKDMLYYTFSEDIYRFVLKNIIPSCYILHISRVKDIRIIDHLKENNHRIKIKFSKGKDDDDNFLDSYYVLQYVLKCDVKIEINSLKFSEMALFAERYENKQSFIRVFGQLLNKVDPNKNMNRLSFLERIVSLTMFEKICEERDEEKLNEIFKIITKKRCVVKYRHDKIKHLIDIGVEKPDLKNIVE